MQRAFTTQNHKKIMEILRNFVENLRKSKRNMYRK